MDFKNKYIKYKSKYFELKQKGGMNCVNERVFQNLLGTCWMVAIQMMICFGDATKDIIERELTVINTENKDMIIELLIGAHKNNLIRLLPPELNLESSDINLYLTSLLDAFIKRYLSKFDRFLSHKPASVDDKTNTERCERVMSNAYKLLFRSYSASNLDGDILNAYFFANVLGTFFLQQEVYFSMHTRNMFNQIHFDEQDIGILIEIKEHVCCFFMCGGVPKFYNDNDKKIQDFNFIDLLRNLKDDEDLFVIPNQVVALNRIEYFQNIQKYTNHEKIRSLTIVSKKNFYNNLNQEIKWFFSSNYNRINNFFLLLKIAVKFLREDNKDKYLEFLINGSAHEFFITMRLLGDYYYENDDIDKAIEYYQKALDNGYNEAVERLWVLYNIKKDDESVTKYRKFIEYMN